MRAHQLVWRFLLCHSHYDDHSVLKSLIFWCRLDVIKKKWHGRLILISLVVQFFSQKLWKEGKDDLYRQSFSWCIFPVYHNDTFIVVLDRKAWRSDCVIYVKRVQLLFSLGFAEYYIYVCTALWTWLITPVSSKTMQAGHIYHVWHQDENKSSTVNNQKSINQSFECRSWPNIPFFITIQWMFWYLIDVDLTVVKKKSTFTQLLRLSWFVLVWADAEAGPLLDDATHEMPAGTYHLPNSPLPPPPTSV